MDNFNLSKYLKNNPLLKSKNKVNESIGGYRDIPALIEMEEMDPRDNYDQNDIESRSDFYRQKGGATFGENDPTYYDDDYGMEKPEEEVTHYFTLTDDELQIARKLAKDNYPNIYVGKIAVKIGGKMTSPGNVAVTGPKTEVENFEKDMEDLDSESMGEETLDY
jgi:hypothetical protein